MTIATINKTVYQGVDSTLSFIVTDSLGVARNITSATFKWTAFHNDTGDILQKALGTGLVLGTAASGQVAVVFTAAEMTIPPLTYEYNLEMTITVSSVTTKSIEATGFLTVEPNKILDEVVVV